MQYLIFQLLQLAPIGVSCSALEYSDQYCILQRIRVGTELLSAYFQCIRDRGYILFFPFGWLPLFDLFVVLKTDEFLLLGAVFLVGAGG